MISDSKIILQRINLPEEKENCNISTWPLDSNNCTALSTGSKFSDWSLPCHCTGLIHFVIQHSAMEFVKTVDVTPSKHNTVLYWLLCYDESWWKPGMHWEEERTQESSRFGWQKLSEGEPTCLPAHCIVNELNSSSIFHTTKFRIIIQEKCKV